MYSIRSVLESKRLLGVPSFKPFQQQSVIRPMWTWCSITWLVKEASPKQKAALWLIELPRDPMAQIIQKITMNKMNLVMAKSRPMSQRATMTVMKKGVVRNFSPCYSVWESKTFSSSSIYGISECQAIILRNSIKTFWKGQKIC